jgi:ZIP family zinc transporter
MPGTRVFLNAIALGILIFIVWDLLTHAWGMIGATLGDVQDGSGGIGPVIGLGALCFAGLGVGLLSLAAYERWLAGDSEEPILLGPGAMAADELAIRSTGSWPVAHRLALLTAVGIGLYNFSEGLAVGSSAAQGEIALAALLVTGFTLQNATEGFGIVAPLAADDERTEWRFLLLLGLIAGGPTLLGTAVGHELTNDAVRMVFLTLAAGSILYVIIHLVAIALAGGHRRLLYWGVWVGLVAGFVIDMLLTAAGA